MSITLKFNHVAIAVERNRRRSKVILSIFDMVRAIHFFYLVIVIFSLSCASDQKAQDETNFHYNIPNKVTSLDPAFARNRDNIWVVDHLYSTLVQFDDHMRIVPDLAKTWHVSDDGLDYTFSLKDSVFYPDHPSFASPRMVKAEDVAYSLARLLDTTVKSPGSWVLKDKVRQEDPFEVINDTTLVLHLTRPFPPMLGIMTMQYCSVLAKEFVDYHKGEIRNVALGTGPFKLVGWKEDQGLFMKKNQNYHFKTSSNIENIRISFISDRKTSLMDLLSGNLDLIVGMDPTYRAILLDEKGHIQDRHQDRVKMVKSPFLNMEYLGVNLELAADANSPLKDKRFRQALNFGLDKKLMMSSLRTGIGRPATKGFIPLGMPGHEAQTKGYAYDPNMAQQLLDSTDYFPNAPTIKLQVNGDYLDLCLFAASQWHKLGINVEVDLIESSLLRQMMRNGESTFFRASWIGDYPDEETFLTVFYGSNPAPPNYTRFHNERYDELYRQALESTQNDHRMSLYQKMDSILIDEAPVVFMYYDESLMLCRSKLTGISTNAFNLLRLDSLNKSQ